MGKFDQLGDLIRGLVSRPSKGVPLDVSDDVARAAVGGRPAVAGDLVDVRGRPVEFDAETGWPHGVESWAARPSQFDGIEVGPLDSSPDFELGSPLWHQLDKGARSYDNLRRGRTPNLRNQNPDLARVAGADIRASEAARAQRRADDAARSQSMRDAAEEIAAAAATVGVVGGIGSMIPSGETPASATTADLAAEARPVPEVPTVEDDLPPVPEKPDYAFQARELINKLNAMRRQAGGEVPEARAMTAEINRLLAMADKERNSPGYQPAMPTDYHGEAQRLIQQLNEMRRKAGGEVPQAPQIMAEVRRLQALGDRMRNGG